jgi:hypothetical protein
MWRLPAVLITVVLMAAPAVARAGDTGLQPLVGGVLLDPDHDARALQRAMGLSLVIQAGRQSGTMVSSLLASELFELRSGTTALSAEARGGAARAVRGHRVVAILAGTGLGLRTTAALITAGAGGDLGGALAGFTVPFLLGAGVDGALAVVSYLSVIDLIRTRNETPIPSSLLGTWRGSEASHLLTGILATFSTVTQILVGVAASDLAAYEHRRGRSGPNQPTVSLMAAPTEVHVTLRF